MAGEQKKIVEFQVLKGFLSSSREIENDIDSIIEFYTEFNKELNYVNMESMYLGQALEYWKTYAEKMKKDLNILKEYMMYSSTYIQMCMEATQREDEALAIMMNNTTDLEINSNR